MDARSCDETESDSDDPDNRADPTVDEILAGYRDEGATVIRAQSSGSNVASAPHSDRGRHLYDWWSSREWLYPAVMQLAGPLRSDTFDALSLESGETVLDLGCGPGTNFERLREAVGSEGSVIGLDYSPGMVRRAAELVDERDWSNVHVILADATETCGPAETIDAVVTTFALHTMPGAGAVIENVREVLRPGGRFVVLDSRPVTDGPARFVNPLYERVIAWAVNHQRGLDTQKLLTESFPAVRVVETYDAGAGYLGVATKDADR